MYDMLINAFTHPFTMLWIGVAIHLVKELMRIKKESGVIMSPVAYIKDHPFQSTLMVIGALAGYTILLETNQLTAMSALMFGYISDSIIDVMGKRAIKKVEEI